MMHPQTPAQKIATLYGVIDWLEANPDKALVGDSAKDDEGFPVDPNSVNATCFCFVGRLQHVTKLSAYTNIGVPRYLLEINGSSNKFIDMNDKTPDPAERFQKLRAYIDELAEGVAA